MLEKIDYAAVVVDTGLPFYDPHMLSNVNRPEDYESISKSFQGHYDQSKPGQETESR
jgi:hypothetical protein